MTFYLKDQTSGKFRRVSKKAAMEYMGKDVFEERVNGIMQFQSDEFDIIYSGPDFKIKRFRGETIK